MRHLHKYFFTPAYTLDICLSQTNKSHACAPIFDTSHGLAEKAIYSHTPLTTGTYALEWNAIQNAENIFSSRQQTAKGTSGSSPCVRTVIFVTVWTFNYCNPPLDSFKNIRMINYLDTTNVTSTVDIVMGRYNYFQHKTVFIWSVKRECLEIHYKEFGFCLMPFFYCSVVTLHLMSYISKKTCIKCRVFGWIRSCCV